MKFKFGCYSVMGALAMVGALCTSSHAGAQSPVLPAPAIPAVDSSAAKKNVKTGIVTPVAPVFSGYLGLSGGASSQPAVDNSIAKKNMTGTVTPVAPAFSGYLGLPAGLPSNVRNAGGTGGNSGFVNLGTNSVNLGQANLGINLGTRLGVTPGSAFINPNQGLLGGVGGVNFGGVNLGRVNVGGINLGVNLGGLNNLGGVNLGGVNNLGMNLNGLNNLGVNLGGFNPGLAGVNNLGLNLGGVNNFGLNLGLNAGGVGAIGNLGGQNFQNVGNFGNPFLQIGGIPQ